MRHAPEKIYVRPSSAQLLSSPYEGAVCYTRGGTWVPSGRSCLSDELYNKLEVKLRDWNWADGPSDTRELLVAIYEEVFLEVD